VGSGWSGGDPGDPGDFASTIPPTRYFIAEKCNHKTFKAPMQCNDMRQTRLEAKRRSGRKYLRNWSSLRYFLIVMSLPSPQDIAKNCRVDNNEKLC